MKPSPKQNIVKCNVGKGTKMYDFINLYGCTIGNNCIIGPFVEIQKDAVIKNRVKVESHSFICSGVTIEDGVFIGHHVVFINDRYPTSVSKNGKLKSYEDWDLEKTLIKKYASIGSNATILPGLTIGEYSIVGAGSVVTKDVLPYTIVAGNPAKVIRKITSANGDRPSRKKKK